MGKRKIDQETISAYPREQEDGFKSLKVAEGSEPARVYNDGGVSIEEVELTAEEREVVIRNGPFSGKVVLSKRNPKVLVTNIETLAHPAKSKLCLARRTGSFGVNWNGKTEYYYLYGETSGLTASQFQNKGKIDYACFVRPNEVTFTIFGRLEKHLEEILSKLCEPTMKTYRINSLLGGHTEVNTHQIKLRPSFGTKNGKYDTILTLDGESVDPTALIRNQGDKPQRFTVKVTLKMGNPYITDGYKDTPVDFNSGLSVNVVKFEFTKIDDVDKEESDEHYGEVEFVYEA